MEVAASQEEVLTQKLTLVAAVALALANSTVSRQIEDKPHYMHLGDTNPWTGVPKLTRKQRRGR